MSLKQCVNCVVFLSVPLKMYERYPHIDVARAGTPPLPNLIRHDARSCFFTVKGKNVCVLVIALLIPEHSRALQS